MYGATGARWSDVDRVGAAALTAYEDGLCSGCGQPRDRAFNPDMEGYFVLHESTCLACAALANDPKREDKPKPGRKVGVVDEAWSEGYTPRQLVAADQAGEDHGHTEEPE